MICVHAQQCGSQHCSHRFPHPQDDFCQQGSCSWGENTRCLPENKRELLEGFLKLHFPDEMIPEIANQIEQIYKEGTV